MEKYKEYIGKKYNYEKQNIEITNIKKVSGNYVVLTNGRTFAFFETEIDDFFNNLKPYKTMLSNKTTLIKQEDNEQDEIKKLLFEAINRVKDNKDYVQQANAICNITSQLINIKKIELLNK